MSRNDRTDISRLLLSQDQPSQQPAITDHGDLTGLNDDDHPQYHNNARGDARYLSSLALDGLTDVALSLPINGQVLIFNAGTGEWTNWYVPPTDWNDITNKPPNFPPNFEAVQDQIAGTIVPRDGLTVDYQDASNTLYIGNTVTQLDALSDVTLAAPANSQVLQYDGPSSQWKNRNLTSIWPFLDDVLDVALASRTDGQVLTYEGASSQWKNKNLPAAPVIPPQEISFQFTAVGNGYYVTTNNCTISMGQEGGTGTIAFNIAPDNSSSFGGAVTLPQAMTAGQTLRVVCTGLTGFKAVTLVKT